MANGTEVEFKAILDTSTAERQIVDFQRRAQSSGGQPVYGPPPPPGFEQVSLWDSFKDQLHGIFGELPDVLGGLQRAIQGFSQIRFGNIASGIGNLVSGAQDAQILDLLMSPRVIAGVVALTMAAAGAATLAAREQPLLRLESLLEARQNQLGGGNVAGVAFEQQMAAQTALTQFEHIRGEMVQSIQQLAYNFQVITGDSFEATAQRLGAALENPIAGIDMIEKSGILITEQQERYIRLLQESGRLGEAQVELFKIINEATTGLGAERAGTLSAKWEELGNTLYDALAPLGETLLPVAKVLMDVLIGVARIFSFLTNTIAGILRPLAGLLEMLARFTNWLLNWNRDGDVTIPEATEFARAEAMKMAGGQSLTGNFENLEATYRRISEAAGKRDEIDLAQQQVDLLRAIENNTRAGASFPAGEQPGEFFRPPSQWNGAPFPMPRPGL